MKMNMDGNIFGLSQIEKFKTAETINQPEPTANTSIVYKVF